MSHLQLFSFDECFSFLVRKGIEEALTTTRVHLDKLHSDIGRTLEKISSREKYLNGQLEAPLQEFRQLTDNLAATKEKYKQVRVKLRHEKQNKGLLTQEWVSRMKQKST